MPEGRLNKQLSSLIETFHKKYSSPLFKPHITLVWPLLDAEGNIVRMAQYLAKRMKSFYLTLNSIGKNNEFFVSISLNIRKDQQLIQARKLAIKTFNLKEEGYTPHLSLAYGNFNEKTKNLM
jgi:2'-5' RNA ligase